MLSFPDLVTGYRCPIAKRRERHQLGEQKLERCEGESEIWCWAWQVTLRLHLLQGIVAFVPEWDKAISSGLSWRDVVHVHCRARLTSRIQSD